MRRAACAFVFLFALASCVSARQSLPSCQPAFPYQQGWLGGDAASSAAVSASDAEAKETLWFFGDTFIGVPGATNRRGAALVNNTVARSQCDARDGWTIEYGWLERDGHPASVFAPPEREGEFYWPLASVSIGGTPYVFLSRTMLVGQGSSFAVVGTDVARVTNPGAEVSDWRIEYAGLLDNETYIPAAAAIVEGDFVYVVGFVQGRADPSTPRFVSRLPLAALEAFAGNLGERLEMWTGTDWVVGGEPAILMDDSATEMGIQRLPDGCGWMVSYLTPIQPGDAGLSENIYIRTAKSLEGPWSERRLLVKAPEMSAQAANGFIPGTVCYAAKLQPQFGTSTHLSITYVCNIWLSVADGPNVERGSDQEAAIQDAMNVYVPRALSVPLPQPANEDGLVSECPWLIE
ncbi:MAG: DUF4185 domain-containing protein [Deltaproteobacteria bacterium]|nr:DUF4185 domain-containing protein [Deltaproteobacteria bacterium]MBW2161916.1 DUF4185 domain-containing protein [Deltaproteobacteria bacterium]MBW2588592.1 DUF4185 domain-containing protein [Deltaproteobacteria bacterium]